MYYYTSLVINMVHKKRLINSYKKKVNKLIRAIKKRALKNVHHFFIYKWANPLYKIKKNYFFIV